MLTPELRFCTSLTSCPNFLRVHTIDMKDCDWCTNDDLRALPQKFPSLQRLDVSGCQGISSIGVRALVKGMGGRLLGFKQDSTARHSLCREMRVTSATIAEVAKAPALLELSLTLGSGVKMGLEKLIDHPTLQSLTLFFEGFEPPPFPSRMQSLRRLHIKTGSWTYFSWPTISHGNGSLQSLLAGDGKGFPSLKDIIIDDQVGNSASASNKLAISTYGVNALAATFGSVTVLRVGRCSDIPPSALPWTASVAKPLVGSTRSVPSAP